MKQKGKFYGYAVVAFLLFFLLNGVLFYSTQCQSEYLMAKNVWGESTALKAEEYYKQQRILKRLPEEPEKAIEKVDAILAYMEREIDEASKREYWWYNQTEEPTSPEVLKEIEAFTGRGTGQVEINEADLEVYRQVKNLLSRAANYKAYILEIEASANVFAESFYTGEEDAWKLKNVMQTQKDYYGREHTVITLIQDEPQKMFWSYHITDLLAFFYLISIAVGVFYFLKKNAVWEMQRTGQFVVGPFLCMAGGVTALYLSNWLCLGWKFSFLPLSATLQSLEEFYVCPATLSVGSFLTVFILMKFLTLFLLMALVLLAVAGKYRVPACIGLVAVLLAEFWLHMAAGKSMNGSVLGEINLFSGVTPERFFNRYLNLQVGSFVVPRLPVFLAVFAVLFLLVGRLGYKRLARWHSDSKKETMYSYIREIDERYHETRQLWHDFNNHLLAIRALYENGQSEQASKYIDTISEQTHNRLLPAKSGLDTLDLLLFKKYQFANERGVSVEFQFACNLAGLAITDYELCSLFGNLLDNAIEATEKVRSRKPVVKVSVKKQNQMVFISFENPYEGELVVKEGEFVTTKKDAGKHGMGLSSVRHICKKYKGTLELETKEQVFVASVLLNV